MTHDGVVGRRTSIGQFRPAAVGHPLARFRKSLAKTERRDLPTALLAGATKAEAAATRRAKRKKERILTEVGFGVWFIFVVSVTMACAVAWATVRGEGPTPGQILLFLRETLRDLCFKLKS